MRSFQTGRTQQVNLRGIVSSTTPCPSGFAAGSVVSPILFNVHVNALEDTVPNHLNVNTHKYVDCTEDQIVGKGKRNLIQEIIDAVYEWADNKVVLMRKSVYDQPLRKRK